MSQALNGQCWRICLPWKTCTTTDRCRDKNTLQVRVFPYFVCPETSCKMGTVAGLVKLSTDQIYKRICREHVLVDRVHDAKDGLLVCETKADVGCGNVGDGGRGLSFFAGARRRLVDCGFGRVYLGCGFGERLQHGTVALLEVFERVLDRRSVVAVVVADCRARSCIAHHVRK